MVENDFDGKKLSLVTNKDHLDDSDRRQDESYNLDIDRRKEQRRQNISGRGKFIQYYNLYNMIYNSKRTTPEIHELFSMIMPDEEWQVRFVQEVSLDRMFHKRKSIEDLRQFFLKHGVIEVHDEMTKHLQASSSS